VLVASWAVFSVFLVGLLVMTIKEANRAKREREVSRGKRRSVGWRKRGVLSAIQFGMRNGGRRCRPQCYGLDIYGQVVLYPCHSVVHK